MSPRQALLLFLCLLPLAALAQNDTPLTLEFERETDTYSAAPMAAEDPFDLPTLGGGAVDAQSTAGMGGGEVLQVEVAGRGVIGSEQALIVDPGEELLLRVALPADTERSDAAPAGFAGGPGRYLMQSERRLTVDVGAGTLLGFLPDSVRWRAPEGGGNVLLRFELREQMLVAGSGLEQSRDAELLAGRELRVLVRYPFDRYGSGTIEGYGVGVYPDENSPEAPSVVGRMREQYAPPASMIKVTPEVAGLKVSEHFTLGDFLSPLDRDGTQFVAIQDRLIEFLDAVQREVTARYGPDMRVRIHRAYLSPNERLRLQSRGVSYSEFNRYQYGDGAAFVLDSDGDGVMEDLSGDGAVDREDGQIVADMVEELQRRTGIYGGIGVLASSIEPGWPETPYVAIDTRGERIRW